MDTLRNKMPMERLYLHLDKFNYLASDTIWFKAYLFEDAYLMPSTKSGIIYMELVNTENQVMKRMKFPVRYGLCWGNISLGESDLPSGTYLLRGYTNWMLNFGQDAVFSTSIYIADLNSKTIVSRESARIGSKSIKPVTRITDKVAALEVVSLPGKLQLEVAVLPLDDTLPATDHYLVALSRDVVCYAVPIDLKGGKIVKFIDKQLFPTGMTRFVVLNRSLQVVKERMVYIDQQDQLKISFSTAHAVHKAMDSITLQIQVADKNNVPLQGSFSLAVTDDGQTGIDKRSHGLVTYILRVSDSLLYSRNPVHDWKELLNKELKYKAEPEFIISGRANSAFKGLSEAKVSLFLQKPLMFMDTIAGPDGRFVFKNIPMSDTAVYKIQARNKKGKNFFVNLEVDEWVAPVFELMPKLEQMDSLLKDANFVQKVQKALSFKQKFGKATGHMLDEVNIEAKKIVKGSYNLNGPGGADQTLTERDMLKEGKKSLYSLLMERVPGLGTGSYLFPPSRQRKFGLKIKGQLVKIIIDGIDVDQSYEYWQSMSSDDDTLEGMQERFLHLKTNLEHFTAEDVKGIEVMYNSLYNIKYNNKFLSQAETRFSRGGGLTGVGGVSGIDYAYIEVTTRSGKGPFMKPTPGTYLYKPLPFSLPLKFQSSGYGATVHWEPNIVTNEKGEALVSFRAGTQPATYSIVMEGSDMNGQLGSVTKPAFITITR
ncbi:hypothetical protein [Pedobacter africanus]|nr:hypothetical protein [Pedobacter africanus]